MTLSVLFKPDSLLAEEQTAPPACFRDLNLDQMTKTIADSKPEYDLKPFFHLPLFDADEIRYRQEVARDLENAELFSAVQTFAKSMVVVRRQLKMISKLSFRNHKEGWLLDTALLYCAAAEKLAGDLQACPPRSRGLRAFVDYLAAYVASPGFQALAAEARAVKQKLASVQYSLVIQGVTFRVRRYEGETDYSVEVQRAFEKFRRSDARDYRVSSNEGGGMNHVEAKILDFVEKLHPRAFDALHQFCAKRGDFLDETLRRFDREIQFYIAYLEYLAPLKRAGLSFCYPALAEKDKEIFSEAGFDLALARKLSDEGRAVVPNDFSLKGSERVLVISGPNQGGKTTFARAFGQMHYLAKLGLPVPGKKARLFLCGEIFTHFEREEDIKNLRGKLQDDLTRVKQILDNAAPDSLVIMNEIFSSTALQDARFLGAKIMERISALDALCAWVTFVDELASYNEKTVSMASEIRPDSPAERTYKIVRKPADGLAYALSIAEKHGLTYEQIIGRISA